jgi:2-phosphoglycerate kinase
MKTVICIGGAPASGKSTLAQELSHQLELPWISTDQIRRIVKSIVQQKDFPNLFYQENVSAEDYFAHHSIDDIVRAELGQAHELWNAISSFVQKDHVWKEGVIIEGTGIIPELFAEFWSHQTNYYGYFLYQNDIDILTQRITTRGLWGKPGSYSESVIPSEVAWVQQYNEVISNSCKKYGLPIFDMNQYPISDIVNNILADIKKA